MAELTGIWQVNLHDMIAEIGEEQTKKLLSGFLCPQNPDVQSFLSEKAILFARQGYAATYLVFMSHQGNTVLVGYYAIAIKAVVIKGTALNQKWRARLRRYASYDEELKQFTMALPLIGQLGKNFANGYHRLITGDELLQLACDRVRSLQVMASGKMAYLECEDIEPLTSFYERNGFIRFANRNLDGDEQDCSKTPYLVQMIKYFSGKGES
ncbi:MAG: N-acetyltransferase [Candidatus Ventricola sp.]